MHCTEGDVQGDNEHETDESYFSSVLVIFRSERGNFFCKITLMTGASYGPLSWQMLLWMVGIDVWLGLSQGL